MQLPRSAKPPGNVVFGQLMPWVGEYQGRVPHFYHFTKMEIGSALGYPCSLLHGMGHYGYRVVFPQVINQLFDFCRGYWV